MTICPFCRETIQDGAIKCRFCGSMLGALPGSGLPDNSLDSDELTAFLGPNSTYYRQQFARFSRTGVEKFTPTWNWSCFGFTFLWMLYRKMYLAALLTFVIFCVPGVNILLHVIAGLTGNYLYYCHARDRIAEIRALHAPEQSLNLLAELGGVNRWVITLGVIVMILLTVIFLLFFATISASLHRFSGIVI